jgi:3-(3-hydroxy-phenyl)propionate hydroxylase
VLNSPGDDNALFTAGPVHGAPPLNICLAPDDYLLDHLGAGFDLLCLSAGPAIPDALLGVVAEQRARSVPIKVTAVGASTPVAGADQTLADNGGHMRRRYGATASGAAYLLRPDQHVCARWLTLDARRLKAALGQALPR